jgi:hypothetical protein
MSGVCNYWVTKRDGDGYKCPWCSRDLVKKTSHSPANPERDFVSCDKKFGGCGLFCFLDAEPNEKFNPNKKSGGGGKSGGGAVFGGSYAAKPPAENLKIAALEAKIATMESQITTLFSDVSSLSARKHRSPKRDSADHSDHSNERHKKAKTSPKRDAEAATAEPRKKKKASE